MRTTVDFPDDVHTILLNIAKDRNASLSVTVADIVARELRGDGRNPRTIRDEDTGLLMIDLGKPTTTEDVRSLDDEW